MLAVPIEGVDAGRAREWGRRRCGRPGAARTPTACRLSSSMPEGDAKPFTMTCAVCSSARWHPPCSGSPSGAARGSPRSAPRTVRTDASCSTSSDRNSSCPVIVHSEREVATLERVDGFGGASAAAMRGANRGAGCDDAAVAVQRSRRSRSGPRATADRAGRRPPRGRPRRTTARRRSRRQRKRAPPRLLHR